MAGEEPAVQVLSPSRRRANCSTDPKPTQEAAPETGAQTDTPAAHLRDRNARLTSVPEFLARRSLLRLRGAANACGRTQSPDSLLLQGRCHAKRTGVRRNLAVLSSPYSRYQKLFLAIGYLLVRLQCYTGNLEGSNP